MTGRPGPAATEARLRQALSSCRLARALEVHDVVESTNDIARQRGRDGGRHGTVVVAASQRRGRGRRARHWDSPPGGLYVSVLVRPPSIHEQAYAAGLQLAAGIAVAETLASRLPHPPELVWPNDVYCRGQKIAGVLVEAESTGKGMDFLVCGLGLNLNQRGEDFDPELLGQAASVRSLGGGEQDGDDTLVRLLFTFESWEAVARAGDVAALARRFEALSPTSVGARLRVRTGGNVLEGTAAGLAPDGALRLRVDDDIHEITVGELERAWRKQ